MWAPYSSNAMALGIITLHWVFYMKKGGTGSSLILEWNWNQRLSINPNTLQHLSIYVYSDTTIDWEKNGGVTLV
jgi:hypothetical protein